MQRYSLYIDHQLVSPLIRQLENIVKTCCVELDEEYETYELRTSIYEEFVFQITSIFNSQNDLKQEGKELKDEELKKIYELTAKLEGINSVVKIEEIYQTEPSARKGRPSKNQEAEDHLIQWVKQKLTSEGKLKFIKKEIDQNYVPFLNTSEKKNFIPVNTYLRMFKKYELMEITIVARGGKEKAVKNFTYKKNLSESFWNKEQEEDLVLKNEHLSEQELESTSEFKSQLSSDFEDPKDTTLITKSSRYDNEDFFGDRPGQWYKKVETKKQKKRAKQNKKLRHKKSHNFFDENSDYEDFSHELSDVSMSNEIFDFTNFNDENKKGRKAEIYDNSKSF